MREKCSVKGNYVVVLAVILFLLSFNSFLFLKDPIEVYAASKQPMQMNFINVTGSKSLHGDATLIDCHDKYVLVDGGSAGAYSMLKSFLNSYCKKVNGKIVFEKVIITHNHSDHVGGILKILNNTDKYTVKEVIKNNVGVTDSIREACSMANTRRTLWVKSEKYSFTLNDTTITVYPPIKKYNTGDTEGDINNSSMIVTVNGVEKYLLLGDLYYQGLIDSKVRFPEIYNIKGEYDMCKFSHHGQRGGGGGAVNPAVISETNWFRNNTKISSYYMTTSRKYVNMDVPASSLSGNELSVRKNFLYFRNNLTGDKYDIFTSFGDGNVMLGRSVDAIWLDTGDTVFVPDSGYNKW